jgi:hypothetical protein
MSTGTGSESPRIRASDSEREQVADMLRAAMTEGRLSLDEGERRLAEVYAATYRDELPPLTEDLPDGGWQGLRDTPAARASARRGRLGRRGLFLAVAAGLVALWALSGAQFFWPLIPLLFLALFVFGRRACAGRGGAGPGPDPWRSATRPPAWSGSGPPWRGR